MRVRKVLIAVTVTAILVAVLALGAIGVDYGTSIYAEYRLSSSVRKAAHLGIDPFVAIVAFPFIPQAMRGNYSQVEIKANAVDHAMTGRATLEATMYSVDLAQASWLIGPDAKLASGLATAYDAQAFPQGVQDARSAPPPGALGSDRGIRSYYLLELTGRAKGVLFVAHTDAAPRGFTLLCRALGLRLAEVASGVIGVALTREWIAEESARLQGAFAALEG